MKPRIEDDRQAEVSPRAKAWLLSQLEALRQQQAGPMAFDDEEYLILRAERFFALQVVISAIRAQM